MRLFIQIFMVILGLYMFKASRPIKLSILFFSYFCFDAVDVPFYSMQAKNFYAIIYLLSELRYFRVKYLKETLVGRLMILQILATIVLFFNSPHYNYSNVGKMFLYEIVYKYLIIAYSFIAINTEKNLRPLVRASFIGMILLTIFGLINFITKDNYWLPIVASEKGTMAVNYMINGFALSDRFRVNSMFWNSFDYGYICIMCFLFHIFAYYSKLEKKKNFLIITLCSLFGVFACGSRTVIFTLAISFFIFLLFAFKLRKSVLLITLMMLGVVLSFMLIPSLSDKLDFIFSMFNSDSNVAGSTLEGRTLQYATVFYYIRDNLWFGRGLDFFTNDLGWASGNLVDNDLYGLEGVFMNYLLERGIIGCFFYIIFYISIIVYAIRNLKKEKLLSGFLLSLLVAYILFSNMTGELSSVPPTLLLVGCIIKLIKNKK